MSTPFSRWEREVTMVETKSEMEKKLKELDEQKKLLVAQKALADAVYEQEKALRTHGLDLIKAQHFCPVNGLKKARNLL
jgi:hypothetical protein